MLRQLCGLRRARFARSGRGGCARLVSLLVFLDQQLPLKLQVLEILERRTQWPLSPERLLISMGTKPLLDCTGQQRLKEHRRKHLFACMAQWAAAHLGGPAEPVLQ